MPYLLENAENPDIVQVRASLRGFAALKLTSVSAFASHGRFDVRGSGFDLDEVADGLMTMMQSEDFKTVHQWMKQHYLWARITLLKSALLTFERHGSSIERQIYAFLSFFHSELARIPNFEVYVAHRYFMLSSREPFFSPVNKNARSLDRSLASMAWDLAHWRSLLEMLLMYSHNQSWTSFPVPYFLSFDSRFIKLTEAFKLQGLLYADQDRRNEYLYSNALARPVSDLLQRHKRCADFFAEDAYLDRFRRQELDEKELDTKLVRIEAELTKALDSTLRGG